MCKWKKTACARPFEGRSCDNPGRRESEPMTGPAGMILPKQRDPRLITIRRGGTLADADHHLLALWAAACTEHVLHFFEAARPMTIGHARPSR